VESRQAGSASQVIDTRESTSEDMAEPQLAASASVASCLTSAVFFDPRGRCGAEPHLPTINAVHIGTGRVT
jgi:hypothetical protein